MKLQIDIAASNFKEKMNQSLKLQAKEIQKLSALIIYNNKVIQQQQEIISKIGIN